MRLSPTPPSIHEHDDGCAQKAQQHKIHIIAALHVHVVAKVRRNRHRVRAVVSKAVRCVGDRRDEVVDLSVDYI